MDENQDPQTSELPTPPPVRQPRPPIDLSKIEADDIRLTRLTDIYQLLRDYAAARRNDLAWLNYDPDDFVQDVVLNIFRRQGLNKGNYDEAKVYSFESLIRLAGYRQIIDKTRAKCAAKSRIDPITKKPHIFASYEAPLNPSEDESFCLADVISAETTNEVLISELKDEIPEVQISPNYSLTWRDLFSRSTTATAQEIANVFGISESRIQQLQKELIIRYLQPSKVPAAPKDAIGQLHEWGIENYADYVVVRRELDSDDKLELDVLIARLKLDPKAPSFLQQVNPPPLPSPPVTIIAVDIPTTESDSS